MTSTANPTGPSKPLQSGGRFKVKSAGNPMTSCNMEERVAAALIDTGIQIGSSAWPDEQFIAAEQLARAAIAAINSSGSEITPAIDGAIRSAHRASTKTVELLPTSESLSCFEPPEWFGAGVVTEETLNKAVEVLWSLADTDGSPSDMRRAAEAVLALRSTSPTPDSNALREALVEAHNERARLIELLMWVRNELYLNMANKTEAVWRKIDAALLSSDPGRVE